MHIQYDSNHIDCALLDDVLDLLQSCEREGGLSDFDIFVCWSDHRLVAKRQAVVILDRSKLLVGYLDLAASECVDLVLFDLAIQSLGGLIESCSLDHGAFPVDEIHAQNAALTFRISVGPHICLL